jgi:quinoprotein glucose dehydrogenase
LLVCSGCPATGYLRCRPSKRAWKAPEIAEWPSYSGDPGGSRFSPLTQINTGNVGQLKVAWIYHTGDISDGSAHPRESAFETTPIMVDGTLYFSTAFNRIIALDPETGAERWTYDPKIDLDAPTRRA